MGERKAAKFIPLHSAAGLTSSRHIEFCEMLSFVYLTMLCHLRRFLTLLCVLRKTTKIRSDSCQCAEISYTGISLRLNRYWTCPLIRGE